MRMFALASLLDESERAVHGLRPGLPLLEAHLGSRETVQRLEVLRVILQGPLCGLASAAPVLELEVDLRGVRAQEAALALDLRRLLGERA